MDKHVMTVEGQVLLREELKTLKSKERPEIILAIATARGFGDLKENAEYHAAREQQGMVEAKIKDIEFKLSNSEIIDNKITDKKNEIIFGCTVELLNINDNSKIKYQIVGDEEADSTKNKISFNSPIGQGLINKKVGDEITITVPNGELNFKVIDIT